MSVLIGYSYHINYLQTLLGPAGKGNSLLLFNRICQIELRNLISRSMYPPATGADRILCQRTSLRLQEGGTHLCTHQHTLPSRSQTTDPTLISTRASLLCSSLTARWAWAVSRRDLWLVQVGTEIRCDPSQDRTCFAQAPRRRHRSSQPPWPGARGGTLPDGAEWQFPHQPWLSSIPSLSACLGLATPRKEAGGRGPA